jgi:hypothetical protein
MSQLYDASHRFCGEADARALAKETADPRNDRIPLELADRHSALDSLTAARAERRRSGSVGSSA